MRNCRHSQVLPGQMISFTPVFVEFSPVVEGGAQIMPKLTTIKGAFEQ